MKNKEYKPPAFPFYVKDWLTSKWIVTASAEHIRVYIHLLCLMWMENDTSLDYDLPYLSKVCFCKQEIIESLAKNKLKINGLKIFDKKLKALKEGLRAKHDLRVTAGQKGGLVKSKQCSSNAQAKGVAKEIETATAIETVIEINTIGEFYEKNIGMLSQHSCQVLQELEEEHKEDNVIKAMKIAVEAGAKNIKYIRGILNNEKVNGYQWEKLTKSKNYAI